MTASWNPTEAARLLAELREDDARMTPGPWVAEADCLYHRSDLDGTIELAKFGGESNVNDDVAIARLRNNAKSLADQLEAALREVERLTARVESVRAAGCLCATVAYRHDACLACRAAATWSMP